MNEQLGSKTCNERNNTSNFTCNLMLTCQMDRNVSSKTPLSLTLPDNIKQICYIYNTYPMPQTECQITNNRNQYTGILWI